MHSTRSACLLFFHNARGGDGKLSSSLAFPDTWGERMREAGLNVKLPPRTFLRRFVEKQRAGQRMRLLVRILFRDVTERERESVCC